VVSLAAERFRHGDLGRQRHHHGRRGHGLSDAHSPLQREFVWQGEENRAGAPLALLGHPGGYVLVTHDGSKPVFSPVAR
jgi:hypothetical protein